MNTAYSHAQGATILVVDDTVDDLHLLATILANHGYRVRSLAEGSLVLRSVQTLPPDLILLDVRMPDIDGYTVCEKLKADDRTRDIPVIFISGLHDPADKVRGFQAGGVDYITKPFQLEEVLARVATHLTLRRMYQQLHIHNIQLQQEIAMRQQVEEHLRQSESALHRANAELEQRVAERTADMRLAQVTLDYAAESIFWIQPDGRLVYVNEAACNTLGYTHTELLSMTVMDVDPGISQEQWYTFLAKLRQNSSTTIETYQRRKDGSIFPVEMTVNYIVFGAKEQVCAFVRDITRRRNMQEALDLERRRLFALLDKLPAYIYLQSPDSSIRFVNRYFREHFGEPDGRPCYSVLFGKSAPCEECYQERIVADANPCVWEATTRDERIYQVYVYPFTDVDNTLLILELGIDITERKRAEEALRQSEAALQQANAELEQRVAERTAELRESQALLQGVLDNSPALIFANDLQGRYLLLNRQGASLFALTPEQSVGLSQADLVPPHTFKQWRAEDQQVIANRAPCVFEQLAPLDDGVHTHMTIKFPLYNAQGEIYAIGGIVTDITERKRMEEELRKLSRAVEQSPVTVVITDTTGAIEYVNPKFTQITGYTLDEARGQNPRILKTDVTPPEVYQELWSTIRTGKEWQGEFYNKKKNGEGYWESASISPITNTEGIITHFIAVKENITERKRAEAELQQAKEAAEAANRAKSAFLANMSHELRTPLNAILGFTRLMSRRARLPAEYQEYLTIICRSGEHLLTLINDILDLSKIEAGRMSLHETAFDLYRLLKDMEDMFQLRAKEKHLALVVDYSPNVPRHVQSDEVRLRQILNNLLSNAIKFTNQGRVTLTVSRKDDSPRMNPDPGDYPSAVILRFSVEDTGPGIAPDELHRLFESFVQTTTGRQAQEGTGLGLAISRKFVQLMGGTITVQSQVGRGSVFAFEIPVKSVVIEAVQSREPTRVVTGLAPDQPVYRILAVDDQPDTRRLLVELLAPLGFDVREASNGQEAIDVWETWHPHLIWMDMRMPIMDGYEATRRIKFTPTGQATIVLALTASAFEEDREIVIAAGCEDFIRKPFREADIFEAMRKYLDLRYTYAEDEDSAPSNPELEDDRIVRGLSLLPPELLVSLEDAVVRGDLARINTLLDQTASYNGTIANHLRSLVYEFQYSTILSLIQSGNEP